MDAYQPARVSSAFDLPPVLIAANSDGALARARKTIEASGLRLGAQVPLSEARERFAIQPSATAVWIELDGEDEDAVDSLLKQVDVDVAAGRYAAVIAAPIRLVDRTLAAIEGQDVELVIDADETERAAALAIARARAERHLAVSDVGGDQDAQKLRQLSDEVSRIAATLARLSAGPSRAALTAEIAPTHDLPAPSAERVEAIIRARRTREKYFPAELFGDPAWDMLLDLFKEEIRQTRVSVSSLCIAAAVPATTALRWLKTLVAEGLFVRHADPYDGRRVFVELAPHTSQALRRYFAEVGVAAGV